MVVVAAFTGHEEEFRVLFAQEAENRLAHLSRQLLELEEAGSDPELVASVFRDAHTLKGAAAVVGLDQVAQAAHALEGVLEDLRSGARLPTPTLVDVLLAVVDRLGTLITLALAGEDGSVTAGEIEELVRTVPPVAPPAPDLAPEPAAAGVGEAAGAEEGQPASPATPPAPAPPPVHSRPEPETVRIGVERLDELVRLVGESAAAHLRVGRLLGERVGVDPATMAEYRELSRLLAELQERTMRARMVPVATILEPLRRAVRDLARSLGKEVRWEMRGEDTELDRNVLERLSDPLLQLVRNAVDHGIEPPAERRAAGKPEEGVVRIHAMQLGSEVVVAVTDDGRGVDLGRVRQAAARMGQDLSGAGDEDAVYAIFRSGLSTVGYVTDISGRGVGLDVVRANVDLVRGRMEVHSQLGEGSEFRIAVPITLAVMPCLLVMVAGQCLAVPMHSVVTVVDSRAGDEVVVEGAPALWVGHETLPLSSLGATLAVGDGSVGPVVVVASLTRRHAFRVDALVGQREVVVKGLGRLVPRLDVLTGASVEPDGSVMLVLDPSGVIERARRRRRAAPMGRSAGAGGDGGPGEVEAEGSAGPAPGGTAPRRGHVLIVDDALTVRELQRSILERAGYEVRAAADGHEALAILSEDVPDLVLTDVEMPGLDGFALTEAIRAQPRLAGVPVLIVTTRASDDDRRRGLEAGADGYIVKHAFDEAALLGAVERLLGTHR